MGENKALIEKLEKAEKQAEDIVQTAKKNRQALLRQAKDKAEEDVKVFRDEQEVRFQKEVGLKAATDPAAEFAEAAKISVQNVQSDYTQSKDKTVKFVASKVLDVPIGLTETQKMVLRMGNA